MKNVDWTLIQKSHDEGSSWRELIKKFGVTNYLLSKANKSGLFISRNLKQSTKLAHKSQKYDYSVYRTPKFRAGQAKFGGLKERAGRCAGQFFDNLKKERFWLQGSWEVAVARFLNANRIAWIKNPKGFIYNFNGKESLYYPDFYLPKHNLYIEVKGYETDKDKAKWAAFPNRLIIFRKKEVFNLSLDLIPST